MATLTTAVDGDDLYLVVSDLPTTHFIQLDDEIVEVEAEFATIYDRRTGTTVPNKLRVLRAALGTTAASHSGGATLVPVYGAGAGGGGSLTLDNTVDPPAEVTSLIVAGATIDGAEATLPGILLTGGETEPGHFFRGPDDPADTPAYLAILESGDLWVDTSSGTQPYTQKVRNTTNDGWLIGTAAYAGDLSWDSGWHIDPDTGAFTINVGPATITINVDGSIDIASKETAPQGARITLGADESIVLSAIDGNNSVTLGADGSFEVSSSGVVRVISLPSADPEVAGQLYTDGAPAPGVPQALKISGGPA